MIRNIKNVKNINNSDMPEAPRESNSSIMGVKKLSVTFVAIASWCVSYLALDLPTQAITTNYNNDYRACTGRLLSVGIKPEDAAKGCAAVLRPSQFSKCVSNIAKGTAIGATEALPFCRIARRPEELGACVVGINRNGQERANAAALTYCSRSLLPARFAQCVVGLRRELDYGVNQAMDICIDGSDRPSRLSQ